MTFEIPVAIEEAEVIVSAEVKADEGELRAVDRLPFIIARQIVSLSEKPVASRRIHELARDRAARTDATPTQSKTTIAGSRCMMKYSPKIENMQAPAL